MKNFKYAREGDVSRLLVLHWVHINTTNVAKTNGVPRGIIEESKTEDTTPTSVLDRVFFNRIAAKKKANRHMSASYTSSDASKDKIRPVFSLHPPYLPRTIDSCGS